MRDPATQELIDRARAEPTAMEIAMQELDRAIEDSDSPVSMLCPPAPMPPPPHTVLTGEHHAAYEAFRAAARELEAHQRDGLVRTERYRDALKRLSELAVR